MTGDKSESPRVRRLVLLSLATATSLGMALASTLVSTMFDPAPSREYSERLPLLQRLEKALRNGADLPAARQIVAARKPAPTQWPFRESVERYKEPLTLSTVLADLRAELFLKEQPDQEFIAAIDRIANEDQQTNPFDRLRSAQRVHFETIRAALGPQYGAVQQSVDRIVDEISNQNRLVGEYLADATMSYRLSVGALVLAIISLIPQVAQVWRWVQGRFNSDNA